MNSIQEDIKTELNKRIRKTEDHIEYMKGVIATTKDKRAKSIMKNRVIESTGIIQGYEWSLELLNSKKERESG